MANKKIRATAELFLNTKDAKRDAKIFLDDLKGKLQDIETAADKMTVFKDMVAYIAQVDKAMAALKAKNADAFAHMFDGLDANLKKQLEGIFGVDGAKLGQLNVLRDSLSNLTLKSSITEIRSFANEINNLFASVGIDAPFKNIDKEFFGRTSAEHIQKLSTELAKFATVWEGLNVKLAGGFNFGDAGLGRGTGGGNGVLSEIQVLIDNIEKKNKELLAAKERFDQILSEFNNIDKNGIADSYKIDITEESVKNLTLEYDNLQKELKSADASSKDFYNTLTKMVEVSLKLNYAFNSVKEDNDLKNRFINTSAGVGTGQSNLYGLLSKYAIDLKPVNSDVQKILDRGDLQNIINKNNDLIEELKTSNDINVVIQKRIDLYDKLKAKLREYDELQRQEFDTDEEEDENMDKLKNIEDEIGSLTNSKKRLGDIQNVLADLSEDGAVLEDVLQKLYKTLGMETPEVFKERLDGIVAASRAAIETLEGTGSTVGGNGGAGGGHSSQGSFTAEVDFTSLENTIKTEAASIADKLDSNTFKVEVVKDNAEDIRGSINDILNAVNKISQHYHADKNQTDVDNMKKNLLSLLDTVNTHNAGRLTDGGYQRQELTASLMSDGGFSVNYGDKGHVSWGHLVENLLGNINKTLVADIHTHPLHELLGGDQLYVSDSFSGATGDLGAFKNSKALGAKVAGMITGNIMRLINVESLSADTMRMFREELKSIEKGYVQSGLYSQYIGERDDGRMYYKQQSTLEGQHRITEIFESMMYDAFERVGYSRSDVDDTIFKKYNLTDETQLTELATRLVQLSSSAEAAEPPLLRLAQLITYFKGDVNTSEAKTLLTAYDKGELKASDVFNRLVPNQAYHVNESAIQSLLNINHANQMSPIETLLTNISSILSNINTLVGNIEANTKLDSEQQLNNAIKDVTDLKAGIVNDGLSRGVDSIYNGKDATTYRYKDAEMRAITAINAFTSDLRLKLESDGFAVSGSPLKDAVELFDKFKVAFTYLEDFKKQADLYTGGRNDLGNYIDPKSGDILDTYDTMSDLLTNSDALDALQGFLQSIKAREFGSSETSNAIQDALGKLSIIVDRLSSVMSNFDAGASAQRLPNMDNIFDDEDVDVSQEINDLNLLVDKAREVATEIRGLASEFSNAMNMISNPLGGNQQGTSSVTGVDINQLGQLKTLLLDIRAAVDAKTQAFEEEYVTVDSVVNAEIESLQELFNKLSSIITQVELVETSLKNIGDNSVQLNVGESEEQLTSLLTSSDITTEIGQLEKLQAQVIEVKNAVMSKTKAFVDEGNIVGQVVGKEISGLTKLSEVVNNISEKVNALVVNLGNINKQNGSIGLSADSQGDTAKTPEEQFKADKTAQKTALTKYLNSLKDVDYVAGNLRKKLDDLPGLLDSIATPENLKDFKDVLAGIKKEVDNAKSSFEYKEVGHIRSRRNDLSTSFHALNLQQQNKLQSAYDDAIDELYRYEAQVKDGKKIELDAIDAVVSALRQKIEAYKEINKEAKKTETAQKKNSKFGDTASINASAKYNTLSRIASDEQFKNSKVVQKLLNNYTQSYQEMIEKRDMLRNKGEDISALDEESFKEAKDECNEYAKELDKLIKNSLKLHNSKVNQDDYILGSDFNYSDVDSRKAALADFAKQMYGVDIAATDFKDNWNKVVFAVDNGDGTFTQMTATFTDARNEIVAMAGDTKKAQGAFGAFFDELKGKFRSIGAYLLASFSFHEVWSVIRQGVNYVREIDSALTELKKVTDETDATYDRFLQTASKTAGVVGSTVSELTQMSAEWARLGYNIQQSADLAKSTAILLNVSEFQDATQASEALISTIQAFGYAANESMHVVDILNEVGNSYAISSDGIATALQDSASALMEGGNNLEQAVALVASANRVVQDPNSVGSALRTISLRLRGTSVKILEEMGEETDNVIESTSKLQSKIKALSGVDILTESGDYKDTYTILKEIGTVWKDMSDIDQAALLELMAGKNRANTLSAILSNMKDLEGAYESAMDAEGSALRENETYLDSIQGRIDLFNNSVQTMWMNFIDSEVVKFIVDLGTGLIQTIEKVGLLNVALIALAATLARKQLVAGLKNIFKPGIKNIQGFISHIWSLITSTKELTKADIARTLASKGVEKGLVSRIIAEAGLKGVTSALTKEQIKQTAATLSQAFANGTLSTSQYLAAMSTMGLKTALQGLWTVIKANPVMWISALVMAAATAFDHFNTTAAEAMEKTKESFEEMRSVVESTKSTIQSLESELASIDEQLDGFDGKKLSFADQEEVNRLKEQRAELQKNLDVQDEMLKLQQENSNKRAIAAVKAYTKASSEGAEETRNNWQNFAKWGVAAVGTVIAAVATGGASLAVQLGSMAAAGIAGYALGNVAGEAIGSYATENKGSYDSWYKTYTDAIDTARKEEKKALEEYQKDTSNIDKLDKWQEMQQKTMDLESEMYEHVNQMQSYFADAEYGQSAEMDAALDEWNAFRDKFLIDQGSKDAKVNALDRLFGEDASEVVKAYRDKIKNDIKNGESVDFQEMIDITGLGDDLTTLGLKTQDVADYFTALGEAGADAVEEIDFSDVVSELAKVEGALGSVKSVMEEFRTDGIVSASTLEGMQEEFGGLGDVWENYVETMMSGAASMAEAQAVTEALVKEYLDKHANDISEDTKLTYIAQLEKFGIDNAKKLVDSYINNDFFDSTSIKSVTTEFGELSDKIVDAANAYDDIIEKDETWSKGNVDYSNRPIVSAETMQAKYPEFDGDVATTYDMGMALLDSEGNIAYTVKVTPILEDGTVIDEKTLVEYVEGKLQDAYNNGGIQGVLDADKNGYNIVIATAIGEVEQESGVLSEFDIALQGAKDAHLELVNMSAQGLMDLAAEKGIVLELADAYKILQAAEEARNAEALYKDNMVNAATNKHNIETQNAALLQKQQEVISAIENTTIDNVRRSATSLYSHLIQAFNRTGQYANYSDEDLNKAITNLKNNLDRELHVLSMDYSWADLFPELQEVPSVELDPDVVASKQKWDEAEKKFQELCDGMNLTVTPDVNFNENNALEETAEVEEAFGSLKDVYDEFKEHNIVSAKSLVGLQETFKNVEGFEEFANILGDSTSTIEEVTTAIQGLANGFLHDFDYSTLFDDAGNLLTSEVQRVASQLENIGVDSANEFIRQKAEAYNAVKEMYGIDLTNYENAEQAKVGWLTQKLGEQVGATGQALVNEVAKQYNIDLNNFEGTWDQKVAYAKSAALAIARANAQAQLSEIDEEYDPDFHDANAGLDALKAEMLYLKKTQAIRDKLVQAEKEINSLSTSGIGSDANILSYYQPTTINPNKLGGNDDKDGSGSGSDNDLDWLDHYFTKIENKIKEKEADLENVISADIGSIDDKNTIIDGIIDLYESKISLLENAINAYENRATALFNGFSSDIQQKILNGSIDISKYDDETAEKIQNYFDYITKASDLGIELEGVKVTVADFSLQKFDNAATAFDNEIEEKFQSDQDLIEAEIGYLEELSKRVDPKLYENLINIQKEEQKVLENKKKTLENILASEIAAGHIQIGDKQWYEMTSALNDVNEALIQSKQDIESFQNSINEIYWDNFEKLIDQLEAVNSELSNLFDLLSEDDKVVDEFGNWTDEGIASLGLLAQQMENAQAKADEYSKAIKDLEKDYADEKYSLDEYNEKMAELKDNYLSEIKNVEDLKDAMVDLNKVRVDAVKEAIDKEIEALEEKNEKLKEELALEKEQYDFQKQVAEKEKSIADIQRRLNALAGDTSASAIAERRKLEAEMAEAKAEMDDMWYEHSIEEQQKSLDESLENYKENKEDEKEALEKWLEEEEKVIQESFDLFNSNVDIVASVLSEFEKEHGIKLSEAVTNPWMSGIDAMEAYRQKLAEMKKEQESAKQNAEDAVDDIVNKPVTRGSTTTQPSTSTSTTPKSAPAYGSTVTVKKSATNFSRDGGNGTKMHSWVPGSSFTVYQSDSDEVLIGRNGGYTGWVKLSDIEGYYKGTTGVKDDQWAFTDELGPELTLHAGPNGRLQYLTKGSGVVTADLTKRLMEWGELDPANVLEQSRPAIGAPHITTNNFDIDLSFGSLVHVDHCDQNTLPDLQKMVHSEFDNMMKTLNQKLKRK